MNDRGEEKKGDIQMYVYNQLGNPIPEGVAIKLGDKVRFKLTLTNDGMYAAITLFHDRYEYFNILS